MHKAKADALTRGFYTVAEASRLLDMAPATVWRYLRGYSYREGQRVSPPAFSGDFVRATRDRVLAPGLSFFDLMEMKMVAAFFKLGVRGIEIRRAQIEAGRRLGVDHPFITGDFFTHGSSIILEGKERVDSPKLEEIARGQELMVSVIRPYMREVVISSDDTPTIWHHPAGNLLVQLNPRRHFGQPVLRSGGVPTRVVAATARTWMDDEAVADWYGLPVEEVRQATAFERSIHKTAA